jgi:thiol-disulfide isomerase/thioredoxin
MKAINMKNQIRKMLGLIVMVCAFSTVRAQLMVEDTLYSADKGSLHTGDKVPDKLYNVHNYPGKQISLADFKGKWILLDLWGVNCGSCIEYMPESEILQNKFKDSLQVILVTRNTDSEVEKVAKIAENVRKSKLPFINGKEQLAGLFGRSALPEYIWINPDGIVRYITYDRFSADTVRGILSGKAYGINEKQTVGFKHNGIPIIVNLYPLVGDKFYIYSYLGPREVTKYDYNLGGPHGSLYFDGLPKSESGTFFFNELYQAAYGYQMPENPLADERIIHNFNDTAHYADPAKQYDYEIIVNKNIPEKRLRDYMKSQFDLFFNVKSHEGKRMFSCLVLKRLNNGHNCFSRDPDNNQLDEYGKNLIRATMVWKEFFKYLNFGGIVPPHTLFDETGIDPKATVKINMNVDFNDLEKVNQSLKPFGLTFIQENRLLDCIVITDPI